MTHRVEVLLFLMGVIGFLAIMSSRFRIPFPILLVFAGTGIALFSGLPSIKLNPELVFVLILPPLLFAEAVRFPWNEFIGNIRSILLLAIGLVLVTTAAVAFSMHAIVPGLSLAWAFVLGAIVSPPDAVAAAEVLRDIRIPNRVMAILKGESLINDASALVLYQLALGVLLTGSYSWGEGIQDFVLMSIGGIVIGLLVGAAVAQIHLRLSDPAVEVTLSFMAPYLSYLPAYQLGFSGVLAVVTTGLFIGHRLDRICLPESRMQIRAIWGFATYFLNGLVFILIGFELPDVMRELRVMDWHLLVGYALMLAFVVIGVRFLWIFTAGNVERARLLRRGVPKESILPNRQLAVMSWAGMRGVVSLAAALAIPLTTKSGEVLGFRSLILFFTATLIVSTLIFQGLSLPVLIRLLRAERAEDERGREYEARLKLLAMAEDRLDALAERMGMKDATIVRILKEHYAAFSEHYRGQSKKLTGNDIKREELVRIIDELALMQRQSLRELRDTGEITEDIRRRIEYDIDLTEQRLRRLV